MRLFLASYHIGNQPEKFTALFRENKKTAIITNAGDVYSAESKAEKLPEYIKELKSVGIEGENLDLRDYVGKTEELKEELSQYGAVWITGGNSFLLRRAMYDSGFDEVITDLLKQDKIIYAGYSAGAVAATPTLIGIDIVDAPGAVDEVYGKEPIWEGLNLVPYSIVPHFESDHPESEGTSKTVEFFKQENIPYRTLRDGQAIVIDGDKEELIG